MQPVTRYAKSGDVHIAYQVFGDGPINLVLAPYFVSNIEVDWSIPQSLGGCCGWDPLLGWQCLTSVGQACPIVSRSFQASTNVWTTSGQLWTLQIWNRRRSLEHRKARPRRRCSLPPIRYGPGR